MAPTSFLHILLPLVLSVCGVRAYTYDGSCVPVCWDENHVFQRDGKVADPKNCRRYYVCRDYVPSAYPIDCPVGEYFDPSGPDCTAGSCLPTSASCDPKCRFEPSKGTFELLAHRTDCTKYFESNGIESVEKQCPVGQYFNGGDCVNDINECCDPCLVYCGKEFVNVADPYDCANYYYCQYTGYFPDILSLHTCQDGQQYSVLEGMCVDSSPCDQLCHA